MATPQQIDDGRGDGAVFGRSGGKVGFYGKTPVVKPTITLGAGTTTTLLAADVAAIKAALVTLGLVA